MYTLYIICNILGVEYIAASARFLALNWDSNGVNVGVLPLGATGRQDPREVRRLRAHSDLVTDLAFSPFDDGILATGSADQKIKIWRIPSAGLEDDLASPELELTDLPRRVERLRWHPQADCLLGSGAGLQVRLWDLTKAQSLFETQTGDTVQDLAWHPLGGLMATTARDKTVRIFDLRAGSEAVMEANSHEGVKDSKVVWVDDDLLLTSGFAASRNRQVMIRDRRKISSPVHTLDLDVSSGILMPLYDPDTRMMFLAGRGDAHIQFVEITNNTPYIVPGLRYSGEQTKGACLVPKRGLNVMNGEVNRLLQVADTSVVSVTWQVPRKSYHDFHSDIFPDTAGPVAAMGPEDWLQGNDFAPEKISLDPEKNAYPNGIFRASLKERNTESEVGKTEDKTKPVVNETKTKSSSENHPKLEKESETSGSDTNPAVSETAVAPVPEPETVETVETDKEDLKYVSVELREAESSSFLLPEIRPKSSTETKPSKFGRLTKFKHLKGTPLHKSQHFDNLSNLSKSTSSESDIIHVNLTRLALPLSGPGGKVAVFEIENAGRIPDGVTPCLVNGTNVLDFAWDPFDDSRLVCGLEDGTINIWRIPEGGLTQSYNEPERRLKSAHGDKVTIVKFNPLAGGIVATAGQDHLVKIRNLSVGDDGDTIVLTGHKDLIYSLCWSMCGRFLATACKDGKVRIFRPREDTAPVLEGGEIIPKKGARIIWTNDNQFLVVSGFSRQSERIITVYRTKDLKKVSSETLNVSPAILIPFYDEDSSTLFLQGKGETTMSCYEVGMDSPHLFPLSPHKHGGSQGFAFLNNKKAMNVRETEFARAYRLTATTIEPVSFSVPRVRQTSHFQDDLFPPTRVLWRPALTGKAWLAGQSESARWVSLQPADLPALSSSDTSKAPVKSGVVTNKGALGAVEKEKMLTSAVSDILKASDELEQDKMEGVAEEEWE